MRPRLRVGPGSRTGPEGGARRVGNALCGDVRTWRRSDIRHGLSRVAHAVGLRGATAWAKLPGSALRKSIAVAGNFAHPTASLAEQKIEKEGLRRRRCGRGRGCRHRRALAGWRWRRTVIFLAQRRARCISRRRGEPGTRRRVERTFAPACREPERRRHGGHQGQPAPSVDGLFHWHPTCPQDCVTAATRRTIPDQRADASVACMNSQAFLFSPIFSFRRVATATSLPDFGHFSARCRRSWCGSRPSARPTRPGTPPW